MFVDIDKWIFAIGIPGYWFCQNVVGFSEL